MYKLLNKLFGWDYVHWSNFAESGIARVYIDGDGNPYYFRYRNICVIDRITSKTQVMWLTCSYSKYVKTALESKTV